MYFGAGLGRAGFGSLIGGTDDASYAGMAHEVLPRQREPSGRSFGYAPQREPSDRAMVGICWLPGCMRILLQARLPEVGNGPSSLPMGDSGLHGYRGFDAVASRVGRGGLPAGDRRPSQLCARRVRPPSRARGVAARATRSSTPSRRLSARCGRRATLSRVWRAVRSGSALGCDARRGVCQARRPRHRGR